MDITPAAVSTAMNSLVIEEVMTSGLESKHPGYEFHINC
jgi:hypothetical protein